MVKIKGSLDNTKRAYTTEALICLAKLAQCINNALLGYLKDGEGEVLSTCSLFLGCG